MAKKNQKDELEDNDKTNEELHQADESFGLPEVEYAPVDRASESDENDASYSHEDDAYVTDTSAEATGEGYGSQSREYSHDYEPAVDGDRPYVPGSYQPPKDNSAIGKVIGLIVVLLLAGALVWFFGFYRPEQQAKEKAKIEQQKMLEERQRREAEARAERERIAEEQARLEEEARLAEAAKPKIGTIETISSRTGRYYVVVASTIDEDLAMDYAKKISKEGVSTTIIKPFGKTKFHRIAIDNHDTWAAAQNAANSMKGQYGKEVWVIKY